MSNDRSSGDLGRAGALRMFVDLATARRLEGAEAEVQYATVEPLAGSERAPGARRRARDDHESGSQSQANVMKAGFSLAYARAVLQRPMVSTSG